MTLKILLLAIIVISLVILCLGVRIFFGKKKAFLETSIGKNPEMQKRNITCVKHDEYRICRMNGDCCSNKNCEKEKL